MEGQETQVPPLCVRCNKPIYDGTIFKVQERFYHNACLHCVICRKPLNAYCFSRGNDFYCNSDFTRLFGAKCSSCSGIISPTENVRIVDGYVYHSTCFKCIICGNAVQTGDFFYMRQDMKMVCKTDYGHQTEEVAGHPCDSDSDDNDIDSLPHHRTSINENQLRMLTSSYQSDSRPTRQMIEKLSRKTGLRPRVVRIWFQNRRAKERHVTNGLNYGSQNTGENQDGYVYNGSAENGYPSDRSCHYNNTTDISQSYQLYCPLDYLQPDTMPPNIDLSATDLRNGEVISPKLKETGNCQFSVPPYMQLPTNHNQVQMNWFKV